MALGTLPATAQGGNPLLVRVGVIKCGAVGRGRRPNHRGAMTAGSQGIDALDRFHRGGRRGATVASTTPSLCGLGGGGGANVAPRRRPKGAVPGLESPGPGGGRGAGGSRRLSGEHSIIA